MDKVLQTALDRFDKSQSAEHEDRLLMEEDFAFAAGEQWPDQIQRDREAQGRPVLTFNRLPAFVAQVVGDARRNKPSIKVHPVDDGADKDIAEVLEGLIRNIEMQSQASTAYLTAFEYAVTGGAGAFRILTEYNNDDSFEQDIRIERITDPFSVSWDHNAKMYSKADATYCFVSEWISKEAFEDRYPDKTPANWETPYTGGVTKHWVNADRVRLAEYWVKEPQTKTILQFPNREDLAELAGMVVEQTKEMPEEIVALAERKRTVKSHKVVRYLLSAHEILEGPSEFPSKYIPIIPVYGPEEFLEGRIRHRSLIRYAKDPQRMYNFWQTTVAEKIANAPKSPYLVTPDQVKGLERFWNKANTDNRAYLPFNPDPQMPGHPKREEPAYVNSAEIQQSQQAVEDLKATMGIFDASLGAQGNETSGRAILARQQEGDTATFAWIDNLARSIQHAGKILVDMIPRVYDTERVVRILGEDEADKMVPINTVDPQTGQLINDITVGKYDVAISVGASYQTKRLETADSMMQFVQAFPQAAEVAGDLIAKNMDWPGADEMGERLKKVLPPGLVNDEDMPEEEKQMLAAKAQEAEERERIMFELDLKDRVADREAKEAKANKDNQDARAQEIENNAIEAGVGDLLEAVANGALR